MKIKEHQLMSDSIVKRLKHSLFAFFASISILSGNAVLAQDDGFGGLIDEAETTEQQNPSKSQSDTTVISPKVSIAIAEIKVGHPTAKLVFSDDVVRDTVTSAMVDQGSYSVIDWSRLSSVLFRRNLEWSDVVKEENQRKEIKDILLNDYFLVGTISSYSERWEYDSGAFSKSKTQISSVKVELFIKDAITNEIIASSSEKAEKKKEISQSLGFGASGGANSALAVDALRVAAQNSANALALKLAQQIKGKKDDK